MDGLAPAGRSVRLGGAGPADRYRSTRRLTDLLTAPLSPEDQTAQSMPDVSPTKWHRAHTSWFFETFVLGPEAGGYRTYDPTFAFLFNSYYETVGPFFPRGQRGVVTRPGAEEVGAYRRHVDDAMSELLGRDLSDEATGLIELGCNHEEQHQELILMDIKHVLAQNPLRPAYTEGAATTRPAAVASRNDPAAARWRSHPGGFAEIGHDGRGFAFDNELPRHRVWLQPFELSALAVTNDQWLEFMSDGGYGRPELWLSEGWATVQAEGWVAPLYWERDGGSWSVFTLGGMRPLDGRQPVCHVSYFEADAFARWSGGRLPTEAEWEALAESEGPGDDGLLDLRRLHPDVGRSSLYGDVWQWTSSAYAPYPGYRPGAGALGEYNGKFMVNQYVLRGGSAITPRGHVRATYRNFFPPSARWVFSGLRVARDA